MEIKLFHKIQLVPEWQRLAHHLECVWRVKDAEQSTWMDDWAVSGFMVPLVQY